MTSLAIDFFKKLSNSSVLERYTANKSLQHPWITRKNELIPLTFIEKRSAFYNKHKILDKIGSIVFLKYI